MIDEDRPPSKVARVRRAAATQRSETATPLLPLVRSVTGPVRMAVVVLSSTSMIVGFAESGVLVLVAHIGVALSGGTGATQLHLGPLSLDGWSLGTLLLLALVLAVVRFAAQVANVWFTANLVTDVIARLRRETLAEYMTSSWAVQSQERRGHLQDLMTSFVTNIAQALIAVASLVSAMLTFCVLAVAAFAVDPLAALVVATTAAALFAVLRPLSRAARSFSRRRARAGLTFANSINEVAEATQDLRVFGVEDAAQLRVNRHSARFERLFHHARVLASLVPTTYQAAAMLIVVGGLGILYLLDVQEIASLSALVLVFVRAAAYGQQAQSQLQTVNSSAPYIELLHEARIRFRNSREVAGRSPLEKVSDVELRNVSYHYEEATPVIEDLSIELRGGEAIGVIGASGAGKSTLVQLLLRLRQPSAGEYLINQRPAADFRKEDWSARFAFVPQDPHLLALSVFDNIRFFRDEIGPAAVESAARRAHIHDEILQLSGGYAAWVGDDGRNLSGGQRQRVAIARALAGAPDVIILDEPTSALDMHSENLVQQTLAELKGDVLTIIVAHRLSTLANCDRIIVLRNGAIEAFDTPQRLLETNDFYRRAVALSSAAL